MTLADLLKETMDVTGLEAWENERTPTPVRVFGVRLHSMGLSLRETTAVLAWLGVRRSHGAIWGWTHRLADRQPDPPSAQPTRVAVDETAIRIDGQLAWLYAAIDTESKLLLDVELFGRRGTDPAAAFLHRLSENHDLSEAVFLVDGYGYLTALARLGLSGRLDYQTRNHIEKWFQTLSMRLDRFHTYWSGSRSSARRWLKRFAYHYNFDRPNQALNGRTPSKEALN